MCISWQIRYCQCALVRLFACAVDWILARCLLCALACPVFAKVHWLPLGLTRKEREDKGSGNITEQEAQWESRGEQGSSKYSSPAVCVPCCPYGLNTSYKNTYTLSYRPAGALAQTITAVPICSSLHCQNKNEEDSAWLRLVQQELLFINLLKVQIPLKVKEVVQMNGDVQIK